MNNYFFYTASALFVYMNVCFVISLLKKRNDIVDVAWGLGFVLVAWVSFFISTHKTIIGAVVSSLVTIWGLRLASHIYARNVGKAEDYRYLAWRTAWGTWFYIRSYFQIYILQGVLLYVVALSVLVINAFGSNMFTILDMAGLGVWIVGFLFESVGDRQLRRFVSNPKNKGKLMTSGLWGYTRHPNYFGEVTQWWGIWLVAALLPNGLLASLSPLTITFLILKISGIPLLEKKMALNPEFEEYKKRVSMFIPMPPKMMR